MTDWGPVVIAVLLFVVFSPGLLFQIPGRGRMVEFGRMHTSGVSILVHAMLYSGSSPSFSLPSAFTSTRTSHL
ncbi:hypothetical protein DCAR_0833216 [Daucus carota subsp. sativus]|uniref:Uncharacterized protein n=1 Tax=Daucus carota subsp. sativus TaxID=79200 RepID=A0A175YR48_DAUCS|nr:hypothetical protein DCAR_0833216 [Daucus carota subsp. sativus]